MANKRKAVALYSGGLDSILAIKLILKQNIDIIGLQLKTPFIENCITPFARDYLNLEFITEDMSEDFKKVVLNPKHGYGKNVNPCIDCRILMFRKAGELMRRENASFIISGEVLGQRPMTQNKKSLLTIDRESGYGSLILRPLSALLLPETEPEKLNTVNRFKLLDIQGRSRKRQIALAKKLGIMQYPAPAGGCKLTEPGFAKRISDLLKNDFTDNDIELLKVGRHFTIGDNLRLVVGRNEKENKKILSLLQPADFLLSSKNFKGPVSLLRLFFDADNDFIDKDRILDLASRITARYCDKDSPEDIIDINIWSPAGKGNERKLVQPLPEQKIDKYLI